MSIGLQQDFGTVVTLGESMALIDVPRHGRLGADAHVPLGFGGAETNVAIGLARLGVPATWVSRLGDDGLGRYLTRELRAEGVHVMAATDPVAPTGLMLKEHHAGRPSRVRYYRAGSAASRLSRADIDTPDVTRAIADATVLHLTGITAALGPGPLAAVDEAIRIAHQHSTLVSFDVNHRPSLWTAAAAAPVLARLAGRSGLLFAGPQEAALLLGRDAFTDTIDGDDHLDVAAELARALAALGPGTVVVKLGDRGALASVDGHAHYAPAHPVDVVDPVGAGDAFVAGYLSRLVAGDDIGAQLATGNSLGAAVCLTAGDWEGLPTRAEMTEAHLHGVQR